jgi:hypothetical protein
MQLSEKERTDFQSHRTIIPGVTMAINMKRVLTSGLAAGTVLVFINILAQLLLGNRLQQDLNSWIPASADRLTPRGPTIAIGILLKLIIGILLVWLYAAICPRFGPGLRTASYGAFFAWILGAIFFSDYLMIGMLSVATYFIIEVIQLLGFLIAIWAGALIYSKESAPGT